MKTFLCYAALLLGISLPSCLEARCGLPPATVDEVECMLMAGDYHDFRAQYSGYDCLVAFYDSLSMLVPTLAKAWIPQWSSEFTFLEEIAPFVYDSPRPTAYCSLWLRGLCWMYLSASGKQIRGNQEGRLVSTEEPGLYFYDHVISSFGTHGTSKPKGPSSSLMLVHEVINTMDQIYCDAILQSKQLRTFSRTLRQGLAANCYVWKIEKATVYNATIPMFDKHDKEFRLNGQPTKCDLLALKKRKKRR